VIACKRRRKSRRSPEEAIACAAAAAVAPSHDNLMKLCEEIIKTPGVSKSFAKTLVERSWGPNPDYLLRQVIAIWLEILARTAAKDPADKLPCVRRWEQPFDWVTNVSPAYPNADLDTAALLARTWGGSFESLMAAGDQLGP